MKEARLLGVGFANYRSFGPEGFLLDDLRRINVLIGKNNCGKSNVLRAIDLIRSIKSQKHDLKLSPLLDSFRRSDTSPSATVVIPAEAVMSGVVLQRYRESRGDRFLIRWNLGSGELDGNLFPDSFDGRHLSQMYKDLHAGQRSFASVPQKLEALNSLTPLLVGRAIAAIRPLENFVHVPNFREIRGPDDNASAHVFSGSNIISRLRRMQHPAIGREDERRVFEKIQAFAADLIGVPDLRLEVQESEDRVIVSMHGNRLPLESYGTGIHQLVILCSALAIHSGTVVSIEEPEIHIHPELQRKFLRFISRETDNTYFITTHSNVFLDAHPDASIYHVRFDGHHTTVGHADTGPRARDVLTDMGYKASDLLQSNGIVWVEGPSDRILLNKWLSLIAPDLVEGIHYSIAFYGGKILAHFCCDDDPVDDLVEVLRINRHAAMLIDRDGSGAAATLNASKQRIVGELGAEACWVTQGREIENYLRRELIETYLAGKYERPVPITFGPDDRLHPCIEAGVKTATGGTVPKEDKVGRAREVVPLMTTADLDVLDLQMQLDSLVRRVRAWNQMEVAGNQDRA